MQLAFCNFPKVTNNVNVVLSEPHTALTHMISYTLHTYSEQESAECVKDVASLGCFISVPPLLRGKLDFMCVNA